jgi:hypothetical protein
VAAEPEHVPAGRKAVDEGLRQAGLADAGLAAHEHEAAGPGGHGGGGGGQGAQLVIALDQGRGSSVLHGRRVVAGPKGDVCT